MKKYQGHTSGPSVSKYPWFIGIALCVAGVAVSYYLAHLHYAVHNDFTYTSFCALSAAVNCQTVAENIYSVFLRVPVAVWGMLGYALMGLVCVLGLSSDTNGKRMWMILYIMAAVACLLSMALFVISKLIIKSLCIMCLISYGINFALLALAMHFRSHRKIPLRQGFKDDLTYLWNRKKTAIGAAVFFFAAVIVLPAAYPQYWSRTDIADPSQFASGVTEEGYHWIGAERPELTIDEFSDYLCFYCRKAHILMRKMLEKYKDRLRIVHRHYPMDKQCNPSLEEEYHKGACMLAVVANCAGEQDKFWRMHDLLFELGRKGGTYTAREFAEMAGLDADAFERCFKDQAIYNQVARDVLEGLKLEIDGTPFYVIGDEHYTGHIPPEVLEQKLGAPASK